jgi:hypothetical protein
MTLYTGQTLTSVIPLKGIEHPNGELLFTEHDRSQAYSFLPEEINYHEVDRSNTPKKDIGDATGILSRLQEVAEANDSHQAQWFINKLVAKAHAQGIDLLAQVKIQSV